MLKVLFPALLGLTSLQGALNPPVIVEVTEHYALAFGPYDSDIPCVIDQARTSHNTLNESNLPPIDSSKVILITTCFANDVSMPPTPTDNVESRTSGIPTPFIKDAQLTWYHFRVHPYLYATEKYKHPPNSQKALAEFLSSHLDFDAFIDELILMLDSCNEGFTYIYIHCVHGHSRSFAATCGIFMKRDSIPFSVL